MIFQCIYVPHLLYSSVDGHLVCIHVLAIVNSTAVNFGVGRCISPFRLCFPLDICPGVRLQGHIVALFLVLWGPSILFSIVAVPVYIPTNSRAVLFSHTLSSICCLCISQILLFIDTLALFAVVSKASILNCTSVHKAA